MDVAYLEELTTDAAPALKRLARSSEEYAVEARCALERMAFTQDAHWSNQKASFLALD